MKMKIGYKVNDTFNVEAQGLLSTMHTQPASPYIIGRIEPLNSTCLSLASHPTFYLTDFKPNYFDMANRLASLSYEETNEIHDVLRTIPIYRDLLPSGTAGQCKPFDAHDQFKPVFPFEQSDVLQKLPIPSNPRKRMASSQFSDREIDHVDGLNFFGAQTTNCSELVFSNSVQEHSFHNNQEGQKFQEPIHMMNTQPMSPLGASPKYTSLLKEVSTEDREFFAGGKFDVQNTESCAVPPGYVKIQQNKSASRRTKVVTKCPHKERKHYAKGLCSTCYHKKGRTKLAWRCPHIDQVHYAKGCCQECYITFHSKRGKNKMKKIIKQMKEQEFETAYHQNFRASHVDGHF